MFSIMLACPWAVVYLIAIVVASHDPTDLPRMLPMHFSLYEQITGVQRRSMDRHWDTEPQHQAHLVWGLQRDEDSFTIANMTLQAPPNLPIVLLERFDHMTNDVDCKGDDGEMSLTFKSEYAFRQASSAWKYINDHDDHRFLLIANHEGCGPGDERQPYIITNVREDPKTLTTHLASNPVELHEVARNFELHFGQFKPNMLRTNPFCLIPGSCPQNGEESGWNTKDSPFDFNWKTDSTQVVGAKGNKIQIFCKKCSFKGRIITDGSAVVNDGKLVACTTTGNIQRATSKLPFSLELTSPNLLQKRLIDKDYTLIEETIPGTGFGIQNMFEIGGTFALIVGFHASGNIKLEVTLEGGTPNLAVTMDLGKQDNNVVAGTPFDLKTPQASVREDAQETSVTASIGAQISYGVKVGPDGQYGEALARAVFPIPEISIKLKPTAKTCFGGNGKGGVTADIKFSVKPVGSFVAKSPVASELTLWTKDLKAPNLEASFPIFCIPFADSVPDGATKGEKSDEETGSTAGTGVPVANAGVDSTKAPSETYNLSDDVLNLHSNQNIDNKFAANQGVQLADNLGASEGSSATIADAPQTYQLSNDYLNVHGGGQIDNQFTGAAQGVQVADGLLGSQNPSSENNVASSSGSSFELGSLPSSAGNVGSNTNYQAFAPDQKSTSQYTANLQGGGDSNTLATSGDSNTGSGTLSASSGNDNTFGAYKPSTDVLGTTTPANGIDKTLQAAQPSNDNNNNQLFASSLGTDPNLFRSPTVVKRNVMSRAIHWFRSLW